MCGSNSMGKNKSTNQYKTTFQYHIIMSAKLMMSVHDCLNWLAELNSRPNLRYQNMSIFSLNVCALSLSLEFGLQTWDSGTD